MVVAGGKGMSSTPTNGWVLAAGMMVALGLNGCAGVRNAIPARALNAPDVSSPVRGDQRPLNFMLLRQDPPDSYLLGPGDVMGVYIERILGSPDSTPPVHYPQVGDLPPAIGYPIPVRDDGTIALPLVPAMNVAGLTLAQAQRRILEAYTVDRRLLPAGEERILVTLIRPRTYNVLVIREDTTTEARTTRGEREGELMLGRSKRGETYSIKLPAYENDVLGALSRSGGLPGVDAKNQITIIRGGFAAARDNPVLSDYLARSLQAIPRDGSAARVQSQLSDRAGGRERPETAAGPVQAGLSDLGSRSSGATAPEHPVALTSHTSQPSWGNPFDDNRGDEVNVITIPLRIGPYDMPPEIAERDIILQDGDVVFVESRDAEVFYTGGLLRGGQHPIPRDYDLDVLGAIAMAGGSISAAAGGTATGMNSAVGTLIPPSRITIIRQYHGQQIAIRTNVRATLTDPRERILIEPNDLVMLEYTPGEMMMNLMISNLNVSLSLNSLWN